MWKGLYSIQQHIIHQLVFINMIMPPATIKAAEAFKGKKKTLVTLLTSIEDILHYCTMQTDKKPLSRPHPFVFCSRSRNYHLFTRVRRTRLFTSVPARDWREKLPPSLRRFLLVVSRGLRKGPSIEKALQWLSTVKVFACLSSWIFSKNRVFFLLSGEWKRGGKVAAKSETNEAERAEKSPKMAPNEKPTIAGLPPLLAWPPLLFPWAPLLPGAWCSTALRNAFPGYVLCFCSP